MVHRPPAAFGLPGARWTLDRLRQPCPWLAPLSRGGISRLLTRLKLSWKRGRAHLHSPDPNYDAKVAEITRLVALGRSSGGRMVVLFLDEMTFYRRPTVASAFAARGHDQACARQGHGSNTTNRVLAAMDVRTGRTCFRRRTKISLDQIVQFFKQVRQAYPAAERIYLLVDNWPVHFHPDVLTALEPQTQPWTIYRPPSWTATPHPDAIKRWGTLQLPIQLVPLPTYAPWTNPIEKLWRWLYQDVLHHHPHATDVQALRSAVDAFLTQFADGSTALLRYVGLLVPD